MCFKGTPRRSWQDITVRFDELGAIYNAFTGKEHTVYYGWTPSRRTDEQLELLADMMRPALPPEEYEMERKVVLEEIAMSDDNFDHHVWNFLHSEVFGRHPLAHEILGERETIENLPRDTMVAYHRQRYAPNNMVLLATGAVEPEAIFAAAARYCETWERQHSNGAATGEISPLKTGVRKLKMERFTQQSLVLLYPSLMSGDPDAETVEAFVSLFGGGNSRCYWNIVQRGICQQAGALWLSYADCGILALYADGEPERCEQMLAALREQARDVSANGFTRTEVQRVKNRRRTQLAFEAENPRTRLMQMIDDLETIGRVRTADERLAAVEAVSAKSIARYLSKYPIDGDGLLLSCGPKDWP
jgi:predicted Zn-dependent peptidase